MTIRAAATTPMGRLIQKIQRQFQYSAMNPPPAGPSTEATPHTPEMMPCIRARCSTGKTTPTMMNASA